MSYPLSKFVVLCIWLSKRRHHEGISPLISEFPVIFSSTNLRQNTVMDLLYLVGEKKL